MKRLFPRAVPEALLSLVIASAACAPQNDVKPGAPVLTMLSIVDPKGNRLDITPEAAACATGVTEGDSCNPAADKLCHTAQSDWCNCVATSEPPAPETPPCSADATDGGTDTGAIPEAGAPDATVDASLDAIVDASADLASDAADAAATGSDAAAEGGAVDAAGEVAPPKGTWSCPAFPPRSRVIATFDRLLDTTPLTPEDSMQKGRDDLAAVTVAKTVTPAPTTLTDYTPNGSTGGLIFKLFGENPGPNLSIGAQPSFPAANTITVALSKTRVLAKDHKTPFEASGAIVDGVVTFKTAAFSATVDVPPNAFPPAPMTDTDAGTDAGADASGDAGTDASGAIMTDAGTDACMPPPPPPPEPTTALANMMPVTITFNAPVDPLTIASHLKVTANGTPYDAQVDVAAGDGSTVTITPKTTWAKSTVFVVTVDDKVVDVFMDKISGAADGTFTTGAE